MYESSVEQFQPYEVSLDIENDFTKVEHLTVKDAIKNITLFDIKGSKLKIEQNQNQLVVQQKAKGLRPTYKTAYSSPWGDASIDPENTYTIELKLNLKSQKIKDGYIEISDNQVEEMALWGDLVR